MKKKNINLLFWKLQKKKLEIERFKLKNYSNYFPIFLLFLLNLKKIFSTFFIIFIMFCVHASRILVISIIAIYTWIWETLFNTNWISNTLIAKKKKNLLFEKKKEITRGMHSGCFIEVSVWVQVQLQRFWKLSAHWGHQLF